MTQKNYFFDALAVHEGQIFSLFQGPLSDSDRERTSNWQEELGDCQEEPYQICGAQTFNRGRPHSNL